MYSDNILNSTITRIEKAIYDNGLNVALENTLVTSFAKSIREQIEQGIRAQIGKIAKENIISNLLLFTKAKENQVPAALVTGVSTVLTKYTLDEYVEMEEYLIFAGERGGQAFLDKTAIEGVFNLKNQQILDYFKDYNNLLIDTVDDYTKRWIGARIQEGKEEGLEPREIANRLLDEGLPISKLRAERIVVTETAKALVHVELAAMRKYGLEEKIWRVSLDERVCPTCLPMEGEKVKVNDNFSFGGDGPPAHVSCRCFLEEVVPADWQLPANPWTGE